MDETESTRLHRWKYYETPEQLEGLLSYLNPTGARETELQQALSRAQPGIAAAMAETSRRKQEAEAKKAAVAAAAAAAEAAAAAASNGGPAAGQSMVLGSGGISPREALPLQVGLGGGTLRQQLKRQQDAKEAAEAAAAAKAAAKAAEISSLEKVQNILYGLRESHVAIVEEPTEPVAPPPAPPPPPPPPSNKAKVSAWVKQLLACRDWAAMRKLAHELSAMIDQVSSTAP
eukprot:SAG22_NODE_1505_length_4274_cov_2.037365_2_plen_231_part_00